MSPRWFKTAASLLVWGLIGCQSEPTTYYFRELKIGPDGHFIGGQRLSIEPAAGSYYVMARGAFIDVVSHYASVDGQPARLVLMLMSDGSRRLLETIRIEQVATGAYGTLSLEKDCFYEGPLSRFRSNLLVRAYLSDVQPASQAHIAELPRGHPTLTEITLVRIMQSSASYSIAAATYEASGRLGNMMQSTVKAGGELVSGSTVYNHQPHFKGRVEDVGLLPEFQAADYLRTHRIVLPPTPKPEVTTLILSRYGFDQVIQVDTIRDGRQASSSYLEPYVSSEDAFLNDRCDSGLRDQIASGEGTTS